jgi:hypothetical protein
MMTLIVRLQREGCWHLGRGHWSPARCSPPYCAERAGPSQPPSRRARRCHASTHYGSPDADHVGIHGATCSRDARRASLDPRTMRRGTGAGRKDTTVAGATLSSRDLGARRTMAASSRQSRSSPGAWTTTATGTESLRRMRASATAASSTRTLRSPGADGPATAGAVSRRSARPARHVGLSGARRRWKVRMHWRTSDGGWAGSTGRAPINR